MNTSVKMHAVTIAFHCKV